MTPVTRCIVCFNTLTDIYEEVLVEESDGEVSINNVFIEKQCVQCRTIEAADMDLWYENDGIGRTVEELEQWFQWRERYDKALRTYQPGIPFPDGFEMP